MQVKQRGNNVVQGGMQGAASNMQIAANPKMFKTLSDSLYEDKPGSIVRELVCNAVDAHVMAGKPDVPVLVHVPDKLEPWFSVKDEGIGLSDEDIRGKELPIKYIDENDQVVIQRDADGNVVTRFQGGIYNTIGASTKDQSNEAIGAFGLGSKTPLAYTDQFSFISIHGGMRRVYIAVIGNDGMPNISLQSETPTDEHPGMEVSLAVEADDCVYFQNAIREQLKFLRVKPELKNNLSGVDFIDIESHINMQNEHGTLLNRGALLGIWIVQGGVGYPLDLTTVRFSDDLAVFARECYGQGAYLEFPIGEIEVTASREGISYDAETIQNITNRMKKFSDKIAEDSMNDLRNTKDLFSRIVKFNELPYILKTVVRHNKDFDDVIDSDLAGLFGHMYYMRLKGFYDDSYNAYNATLLKKHSYYSQVSGGMAVRLKRQDLGQQYMPQEGMVFIYKDTNKKPMVRIRHYCKANDYPPVFLIEGDLDATDSDLKKIAKMLHIDPSWITRLSDYDVPKNAKTSSGKRSSRPKAYKMNTEHSARFDSMHWESIFDEIDDLKNAVYVPMDRHNVLPENTSDYNELIKLIENDVLDYTIYAVNQQTLRRIKDGKIGSQLLTPTQVIDGIRDELDRAEKISETISKYKSCIIQIQATRLLDVTERGQHIINVLERRVHILEKRMGKYSKAYWTGGYNEQGRQMAHNQLDKFYKNYPMVRHLASQGRFFSDATLSDVEDYIKMMDAQRGA